MKNYLPESILLQSELSRGQSFLSKSVTFSLMIFSYLKMGAIFQLHYIDLVLFDQIAYFSNKSIAVSK